MGRLKAVVKRCWDCGHVHSGVKMKRARSCYRCELCGTFNDSFFAIYTVKTVIYDKPSILNNWTKKKAHLLESCYGSSIRGLRHSLGG